MILKINHVSFRKLRFRVIRAVLLVPLFLWALLCVLRDYLKPHWPAIRLFITQACFFATVLLQSIHYFRSQMAQLLFDAIPLYLQWLKTH